MDKLLGTKNILQPQEETQRELDNPDFIVTTGRGRKKKAHIPRSEGGGSLCGHEGDSLKGVDGATVDKFYSVCSICRELSE